MPDPFVETVLLEGHILDSLILSKVLDHILKAGAHYELVELDVGRRREDTTRARLFLRAESREALDRLLAFVREHGGVVAEQRDVSLASAPADGVFPEGFYATTNLETWIRFGGRELRIEGEAMDLGVRVDPDAGRAFPTPMDEVRKGELYVTGSEGVRIVPLERPREEGEAFGFMRSEVSSEKPRQFAIRQVAAALRQSHREDMRNLLVLGPAVVHSGGAQTVARIINSGIFDVIFGGNALAVHDLELALYGTSLGVNPVRGRPARSGHQNHLRAINTIRAEGGIAAAIASGTLTCGIMHAAFTRGVDVFLAGSIRDDGPLPEVCTDAMEAKRIMRKKIAGVGVAVMVATALHSIATGNILPARVKIFSVDIHPGTVTKLLDRGSSQSIPIVMDCESFFHELEEALG